MEKKNYSEAIQTAGSATGSPWNSDRGCDGAVKADQPGSAGSAREAHSVKVGDLGRPSKNCCLLTDFGSTYTKVSLVDLDAQQLLGQASAFTTITTSVIDGFDEAVGRLGEFVDLDEVTIVSNLACSSAGGGLKLIAIGLAPDYTVEAARRAALGAGARILKSYSYFLKEADLHEIEALRPDIILLSGGENGGNKKCIIENARMLARLAIAVPIIVAGNEMAHGAIEDILAASGSEYYFTENVMPSVNHLNVLPVRAVIRRIFMEQIVHANGMQEVQESVSQVIMPTPTAVLSAAELLARGAGSCPGLGDLMVIDIGGATTDIHSVSEPLQDSSLLFDDLEEPYSKRTVEGDLGMRYSAFSVYESLGEASFLKHGDHFTDSKERCLFRTRHPNFVPKEASELAFDAVIAKNCVQTATLRHAGTVRPSYRNGHNILVQSGKDLRNIKLIIGTGGVLINNPDAREILRWAISDQPAILAPVQPRLVLDQRYLLAAMGLLSSLYPETACRILIENLTELQA